MARFFVNRPIVAMVISILMTLIGVVAIVAGAAMLKRQPWARSVLEGLCWTTALEIALVILGWKKLAGQAGFGALPNLILLTVIVAPALTYVAAAILAIRALRSPALYDELEQPSVVSPPGISS